MPESPDLWIQVPDLTRVCSTDGLGVYECPGNYTCGNPQNLMNLNNENISDDATINYGITNFDNLGSSLLSVFQIVTTVNWVQLMLDLMDADIPVIGAFYCFLIIILCSFFLMNLILAVIIQTFTKIRKRELEQEFYQLK